MSMAATEPHEPHVPEPSVAHHSRGRVRSLPADLLPVLNHRELTSQDVMDTAGEPVMAVAEQG
ncbi:hypothetical protein [Streptomyces sp. 2A115]|uniref:hypothetical protein n=1 Tax=Streptomyces sp. 2A115 TaxID=3457439 RepID=UPI003FD5C921